MENANHLRPDQSERGADLWRTMAAVLNQAATGNCRDCDALVDRADDPEFTRDMAIVTAGWLATFAMENNLRGPFIALNDAALRLLVKPNDPKRQQRVLIEAIHAIGHLTVQMVSLERGVESAREWTQGTIANFAAGHWEMPQ